MSNYPITADDEKLALIDPLHNSLEARSLRILESEIAELEERLHRLRFAAATIAHHVLTAGQWSPPVAEQIAVSLLPDMGSALDAKVALIEKARLWRSYRQPIMGTAKQLRAHEAREREARFQLANAALMWLWHEEHPSQ